MAGLDSQCRGTSGAVQDERVAQATVCHDRPQLRSTRVLLLLPCYTRTTSDHTLPNPSSTPPPVGQTTTPRERRATAPRESPTWSSMTPPATPRRCVARDARPALVRVQFVACSPLGHCPMRAPHHPRVRGDSERRESGERRDARNAPREAPSRFFGSLHSTAHITARTSRKRFRSVECSFRLTRPSH